MIKKNKNGKVVEFEYEAITKPMNLKTTILRSTIPSNCDEIEARYGAAVKQAAEKSMRSLGAALKALQDEVAKIEVVAKTARKAAKARLAQFKQAAALEKLRSVGMAEKRLDAEIEEIRMSFYAAMNPINTKVKEIEAEHQAKLEADLAEHETFRQKQLASLVEKPLSPPPERSSTERSSTERSSTERSATEQPATERSATERSATEQPTTEQPTTDVSTAAEALAT
jgi:hypothetical protein